MSPLLLDSSIWIAAKDRGDRYFEASRQLAVDSDQPVAALDLTLYEVANVVGGRMRRSDEALDLCRLISARCAGYLIVIDAELVRRMIEMVAEHGLTAYDAAYVAAARRYGWTLVSTDLADLVSKGLAVAPDAADYP